MFFSTISIIPALAVCFIWTFLTRPNWQKGFILLYTLFLIAGFKHFVNDLLRTINLLTQPLTTIGIYLKPLPEAVVPLLYNGIFFSTVALLFTSALLFALRKNNMLVVLLTTVMLLSLQLVFTTQPPLLINILYFSIVLVNLFYMKKINEPAWKTIFALPILLGVLMMVGTLFIQTPQKDTSSSKIEKALTNQLTDMRYFNGQSPILSDGNLLRVSAFQPTEATALKIVMELPIPLYLKGFIGEHYVDSSWQQVDSFLSKPLLDALKSEQFTSSQQIYLAAKAGLGEQTISNMTVQNINASSRYFYTPYELVELKADSLKTAEYEILESTKLFGERTYQLSYMENTINNYPKIAKSLYALKDAPYLNYESYYNNYVYEQFLQLPEETKAHLLNHLGEDFTQIEQLSYEKAIKIVSGSVESLIQYNEDVEQGQATDFLLSLLEETREGYSIHYATVGTLLFRTLGIPARYVEGYIVTPKDIVDLKSYSEIDIPNKNAHAWTEIYIDMVGWVPIELTPPYKTVMPPVNITDYPEATASKSETSSVPSSSADGQVKQVQADTDLPDTSEQINETAFSFLYILFGILILLVLLVLFYLYKLYRTKKNKHLINHRQLVIYYFSLLLEILEDEGLFTEQRVTMLPTIIATNINSDLEMQMQQCVESYQKAMYSPNKLTKVEVENIKELYVTLRKSIGQSKRYPVKWTFLWRYHIKNYFV